MPNRQPPQKPSCLPAPSFDDGVGAAQLRRAMGSMCGRSPFPLLQSVFKVAREHFGYRGTIDDAKRHFELLPEFSLEQGEQINNCRIWPAEHVPDLIPADHL